MNPSTFHLTATIIIIVGVISSSCFFSFTTATAAKQQQQEDIIISGVNDDWKWPLLFTYSTSPDDQGLAGGPVIANSTAIAATADTAQAFNATGAKLGKTLWTWGVPNGGESGMIGVSPTIIGTSGIVAMSLTSAGDTGGTYCTAKISDGTQACCYSTPAETTLGIAARVTSYKNFIIVPETGTQGDVEGTIRLQDPFTCTDVWSVQTYGRHNPVGQVTAAEDLEMIFWCDDKNGLQHVQVFTTNEPHRIADICTAGGGAPGVKDGIVYIAGPDIAGTKKNMFYKVEPQSGQILFSYQTAAANQGGQFSKNQIAFWKDEIVFASMNTGLYAFNINGTDGIDGGPLRWKYTVNEEGTASQLYGPAIVIGDDPDQNARSDGRFEKYYSQVLIVPSVADYVMAFDPFSGDFLWQGNYGSAESGFPLQNHNGTTFVMDTTGEIYAFAACAGYAREDCPVACLQAGNGCGCHVADRTTCDSPFVRRRCQWCGANATGFCGYRAGVLAPESPSCDCSAFDHNTCIAVENVCQWCPAQDLCSNRNRPNISYYNYECDCRTYSRSRCSAAGSANCRFCEGSTDSCTAASLPCECLWIPSERLCDQANSSDCTWCPNTKTCSPIPFPASSPANPTCSCNHFNKSFCTSQVGGACRWCEFGSSSSSSESITAGVCANECKCSALDETTCNMVEKATNGAGCKFCSTTIRSCINPQESSCDCGNLDESQCKTVQQESGACGFCMQKQVCVNLLVNGTRISNETACQCINFSKDQCRIANFNDGSCKYCSAFDTCVASNQSCTCEHFPIQQCETAIKSGVCKACTHQGICTNALHNPNCSCSFYDKSACASIPVSQCIFCDNSKSCESNVNAASQKYPTCSCYARNDDFEKCQQTADCKVFEGVVGVDGGSTSSSSSSSRGKPFCAPASIATQCAPTSCTSIGSNQDLCQISGCHFEASSSSSSSASSSSAACEGNSKCFTFFLNNFVPQSWFLLVMGLIKDMLVLILLGSTEIFQRTTAKVTQRLARWLKRRMGGSGVDFALIPDRMDETVYICDELVRDGDLFKNSGDFSTHVWKVCDQLFYWSEQPTQRMKQKLFDAVAFSLVSNQSWVAVADEEVEEIEKNIIAEEILNQQGKNNKPTTSSSSFFTNNTTPNNKNESTVVDENSRLLLNSNNNDDENNNNNDDDSQQQRLISNVSGGAINKEALAIQKAIQKKKELSKKRRKLRPQTLERNEPQFFRIVDNVVTARTNYYIFYSHSRELSKRISSSINLFPDQNTLFFYVAGIVIMFASTLISVLQTDRQTIQTMTNGCGTLANFTDGHFGPQPENPWWWTTTASPSSGNGNQQQQYNTATDESSSVGGASFFLTGYRLMNASSFATACLVFVKFVRGLAQKRTGGGLEVMTVEEKIPILTVTYSFGVQVLLGIYAILILPFALTGFLYGWPSKGIQCGVPLMVGAALILVDYILVRVFTKEDDDPFQSSDVADDADDVGNKEDLNDDGADIIHDTDEEKQQKMKKKSSSVLSKTGSSSKRKKKSRLSSGLNDVADEEQDSKTEELVVSPREARTNNNNTGSSEDDEEEVHHSDEKPLGDGFYSDAREAQREIEVERESSRSLLRAILYFLLTQELPTIILTLMFQMSFNYCALLEFPREFALIGKENQVYERDAAGRSLSCTLSLLEGDISAVMSDISSFLPFM